MPIYTKSETHEENAQMTIELFTVNLTGKIYLDLGSGALAEMLFCWQAYDELRIANMYEIGKAMSGHYLSELLATTRADNLVII